MYPADAPSAQSGTTEPRGTRIDGRRLARRALRMTLMTLLTVAIAASLVRSRLDIWQWLDLLLFGITIGSIYALVAMGYTMVYGVLRLINFAHGDITMTGAFSGYFVIAASEKSGLLQQAPVLAVMSTLCVAVLVATTCALLVERIAYRPFQSRGIAPLICAIGASIFIEQTFRAFFGSSVKAYPDLPWGAAVLQLGALRVPKINLLVIACAIAAMSLLYLVVHNTRAGIAIRAVSEDPDAASLLGVDVDRVVVLCFAIGGTMAGIAGVFHALVFHQVHFYMGFALGIKAFGSAVLGGIGNIVGAMAGGLSLGIFESMGPALLLDGMGVPAPYQLRELVAFALLMLVLIFRPRGLFGERLARPRT